MYDLWVPSLQKGAQPWSILAQPALVLAVVRAARLEQSPETLRVVHDVDVRDLVLDHVGEYRLGRQKQPPREAHRAGRRAAGPAARRVADLELRVRAAGAERGPAEPLGDLAPSTAAVPAHERVADRVFARRQDADVQRSATAADAR